MAHAKKNYTERERESQEKKRGKKESPVVVTVRLLDKIRKQRCSYMNSEADNRSSPIAMCHLFLPYTSVLLRRTVSMVHTLLCAPSKVAKHMPEKKKLTSCDNHLHVTRYTEQADQKKARMQKKKKTPFREQPWPEVGKKKNCHGRFSRAVKVPPSSCVRG